MDDWHTGVAELRRREPVLLVDLPGFERFWVLTRHADVLAVSRSGDRWRNTPRSILESEADWDQLTAAGLLPASLVHMDGEQHRSHRQVLSRWFSPAMVARRRGRIEDLADIYVDRMKRLEPSCDFAVDVAQPFTLRVLMDLLGIPDHDESLMLELTQGMLGAADPEYLGGVADRQQRMLLSILENVQYFGELSRDRRNCPREDLATAIANGSVGGQPISDYERLWHYMLVATAGHDTASFALAGGVEVLMRNPDDLCALGLAPELIDGAVEEIVRWTSPVRHFMRQAVDATEVGGTTIPSGGRVLLSYPSANRDESVFGNAMAFDVRRPDADKGLAFGFGPHRCLGAHLARCEIATLLRRLLPRLARIEPAGEATWSRSHFVSGVKHLPISFEFR